jgi:uncharacterized protein
MQTIILDTNIFISALIFGGKSFKFLKEINDQFTLIFSPHLIDEIETKLITKFKVDQETLDLFHSFVATSQTIIPTKKVIVLRDPNDNFLLELAQHAKAHYLISGDKDVLELTKWKTTYIYSMQSFRDNML